MAAYLQRHAPTAVQTEKSSWADVAAGHANQEGHQQVVDWQLQAAMKVKLTIFA